MQSPYDTLAVSAVKVATSCGLVVLSKIFTQASMLHVLRMLCFALFPVFSIVSLVPAFPNMPSLSIFAVCDVLSFGNISQFLSL